MLKRMLILLLSIMTILIVSNCEKEESDVQELFSDKQSQAEQVLQNNQGEHVVSQENLTAPSLQNEVSDTSVDEVREESEAFSSTARGIVQESAHSPTSQQKIVYTKLNSWNNNKDYYEIAFNQPISESISSDKFKNYIEFSPKTEGEYQKIEEKIVRFYPEKRFSGDINYKVEINQAKLLDGEFAKVQLSFYNVSPTLYIGQVALRTTEDANQYYLEFALNHYRGRYLDSDYMKGVSVRVGSSTVNIASMDYDNSNEMILKTLPFTASNSDRFMINLSNNIFKTDSNRQTYYSNLINEMRKFSLYRTNTVTDDQGKARIELSFSKNLEPEQSLIGLINVSDGEDVEISIAKFMQKAVITGNFDLNKEYTVQIKSGIRAVDGSVLTQTKTEVIKTYNRDRLIEFADQGVFLSSINDNSINIKVVNHEEINYQLWSVQVENIAEMIHNINIAEYSKLSQYRNYRSDNLHWYGELVKEGNIDTEVINDKDTFIKLDLGVVVKSDPNKIYILNVSGTNKNYKKLNIQRRYSYYSQAKVSKMLLFTDLALTAKAFKDKVIINVVDVTDATPIKRADVQLRGYNNTLLASGKTNRDGELTLDELARPLDSNQFFVVAERKGAIGFLSSESMYLDNTKFRVERDYAQTENKLEAWLDRTEYRPGETVNLSIMVRDSDNKVTKQDLPLIVTVYDPKNAKLTTEKLTEYKEGFALYKFETQESSNTGTWRIEVEYGTLSKFVGFSIETFVPERINVKIKSDKESYSFGDKYVNLTLTNSYLFGAPVVGANCQLISVFDHNWGFAKRAFSDYSFVDEFTVIDYSMFNQKQEFVSDANGIVDTSFKLIEAQERQHPYTINIASKITEEGGRTIERNLSIPVSPLKEYIGLSNNRYLKPKAGTFKVPVVVVDESGENLAEGKKVEYVVYGKRGSWWWDYDSNYRASFKNSESTAVIDEGIVTIGKDSFISFTPQSSDFHLFIVEAKLIGQADYEINHKYFNSYWGDNSELTEDSSLQLKTDKNEYEIGEKVKVSIPAAKGSKIYLTVVKKDQALRQEIINVEKSGDYIYELETDATMTPNVFIDVRVIQGQENKKNDFPLRLYGIIPVKIIDKSTRLDVQLDIPEKINSNSTLSGKIDVGVNKKTQYLVSIVDIGLVNRSNYSIPNPWNLFYASEGYYAQDYDNFSYFVNAQNLEIFRTIMIGGGAESDAGFAQVSLKGGRVGSERNRLQETGVKRFEPVTYFLGILETDSKGKGEFAVDVSDYIGALRVTVVAVNDEALGMSTDYTIVKDDIIALPTLPRVLSPNDEIQIPISVIVDPVITSAVEVELITNDLVKITSEPKQVILAGQSSSLLIFSAKVKNDIGKAEFIFNIKSKEFNNQKKIDVGVRLPSAYQNESKVLSFSEDELNYAIPELGYASANQVYLSFTQGFEFDADQHLRHSIRYPYGGAIMNTATTFVQLLLSDFITDPNLKNELDANINTYFQKIVRYNKQGLWEWQGHWDYDDNRLILNTYALHTCILAKEKGYNINDFVYSEILNYLKSAPKNDNNIKFEDAYRLYVLALSAGKPNLAELNYYNEQQRINVRSNAVTMLEMAYKESGFDIKDITKDLNAEVVLLINDDYVSYLDPSEEVSQALELYTNSVYNNSEAGQKAKNRATAEALAKKMQSPNYWNHYDKGWNLFALAGYVSTLPKDYQNYQTAELEVSVDDKVEKIEVEDSYVMDLSPYKNMNVKVKALSPNAKDVMVTVNNVYVPMNDEIKSVSENINVYVIYTDLNGGNLDVSSLEQGQSFYAEIRTEASFTNMEFATTYILPAGWEFSTEEVRMNHYFRYDRTESPVYTDIRDDRVIVYGKKRSRYATAFKCKINTITKGKFMMPATTSEDIYQAENKAVIKGQIIEVK